MIAWGDVYKVVAAMAPLYFALGLGYSSVRWWRLFTPEQCGAINTLVVHFSMPFFTFDFLARADPYAMDRRVLAADAASKAVAAAAVACWWWLARFCSSCGGAKQAAGARSSSWCVTGFSLSAYNNTLVVGVPLLDAMYGAWARDLIVQIAVVQALVWFPLLLLVFELRKALVTSPADDGQAAAGGGGRVEPAAVSSTAPSTSPDAEKVDDVEMNAAAAEPADAPPAGMMIRRLWPTVRTVGLKLAGNPNVYASVLGVVWACIAFRYVAKQSLCTYR
jgi:auxin efflux carrier family